MPGFDDIRTQVPAHVRINQAIEKLKQRGVKDDYCPRCNTFDWNVDILDVPASSAMMSRLPGGAGIGNRQTDPQRCRSDPARRRIRSII